MEVTEEYHDPDYPEAPVPVKEEARVPSEEEKIEKIKAIIRREFSNELGARENEVMTIEQRMSTSRRMLHRLRYAVVNGYYAEQKLMLSNAQAEDDVAAQHEPRARAEISSLLRDGQRRLHPSVRKLLGKQTADLAEIFKTRAPRNKARKDYSAMVQSRNYTIPADATTSLRPERRPEPAAEAETTPIATRPRKLPRQMDPQGEKVLTIDEATRNQMKRRYRLIVGNTSKYAPPASKADRSTHKWLLYVRGPASNPDPSPVLTHVVARLHHSYAPHHTVHVYKPPFHISRRGWGEFPARVELHFPLPAVNRPATLDHTIKLDRNYTGMQTLGSETVVEVWLYSTPEMLPFEYTDPVPDSLGPPDPGEDPPADDPPAEEVGVPMEPKVEPMEDCHGQSDSWMEFFSKDTTELDVDEMIIKPVKKEIVEEKSDMECEEQSFNTTDDLRTQDWCVKNEPDEEAYDTEKQMDLKPSSAMKRIMKYIDSTTGKIYYLEMDRTLDLSKVQEIVINNTKVKISPIKSNGLKNFRKKKGGVSLLKPEVQNQLKGDVKEKVNVKQNYNHIENDHCYLGNGWMQETVQNSDSEPVKKEKSEYSVLCEALSRFTCVRVAVNYLLKKIPVITDLARDPDYVSDFPFVVESEDRYWKLDFVKRRNIEWSRAKLITRMVSTHCPGVACWRTRQVALFARLHGLQPTRPPVPVHHAHSDWSSWDDLENTRKLESNIKEIYPTAADISSLSLFNPTEYLNSLESVEASDDEVEIVDVVGAACDSGGGTSTARGGASDAEGGVSEEGGVVSEPGGVVSPNSAGRASLRLLYVQKAAADIGIDLRNEDMGNGYSYSAVHEVLLSAMKSFAEDLIRSSLAHCRREQEGDGIPSVWSSDTNACIRAQHVYAAARSGRLRILSGACTGTVMTDTTQPLKLESNIKEIYPTAADISSLTLFNPTEYLNSVESVEASDDEVEIVDVVGAACDSGGGASTTRGGASDTEGGVSEEGGVVSEPGGVVSPSTAGRASLRLLYVQKAAADIGIDLRNEDMGNGYSYSAVHEVLLSAMKSFAEDLIRSSLAHCRREQEGDGIPSVWSSDTNACIRAQHVYAAARSGRLRILSGACTGTVMTDTTQPL